MYTSSCDTSCTQSTIDAIREICTEQPSCNRHNHGNEHFQSMIIPVTNLTPQYSGATGVVEFSMRRRNKTVTLQWEPFSGIMGAGGINHLTVTQSISNRPPYPVSYPIVIRYMDTIRVTNVTIDPYSNTGNIFFYLTTESNGSGIALGDSFYVYGSTVTWLVE